jgi:hypothetical protein
LTQFLGGDGPVGTAVFDYEGTLRALLSLIGRQVLVVFSGVAGDPFVIGVQSGRLDRGELDERLQALMLGAGDAPIETLFFHVGSRQSGFVLRPDDFRQAFWQTPEQLTIHLGQCAVTLLTPGELGDALRRAPQVDDG